MNTRTRKERDEEIVAKWDEYRAAPENRYLRPTPLMFKIAAILEVSYPTVLNALVEAGRYTKR